VCHEEIKWYYQEVLEQISSDIYTMDHGPVDTWDETGRIFM
jgi:hypothetical protein